MPHVPVQPDFQIRTLIEAEKDIANVMEFTLTTHTRTHLDAPSHLFKKGKHIDEISLEKLVGTGVVLDLSRKKPCDPITGEDLRSKSPRIQKGDIVLLYTWLTKSRLTSFQNGFEVLSRVSCGPFTQSTIS